MSDLKFLAALTGAGGAILCAVLSIIITAYVVNRHWGHYDDRPMMDEYLRFMLPTGCVFLLSCALLHWGNT